jgi:hypothetical protein
MIHPNPDIQFLRNFWKKGGAVFPDPEKTSEPVEVKKKPEPPKIQSRQLVVKSKLADGTLKIYRYARESKTGRKLRPKLTKEEIDELVEMACDERIDEAAKKFRVCRRTVLWHRKRWLDEHAKAYKPPAKKKAKK